MSTRSIRADIRLCILPSSYGPKQFFDPLPDLSETAQDIGVYHLLTDVPRFLIDQGADLSAREKEAGRTPLELAQSQFDDETDRSDVIAMLEAAGPGESAD